MQKQWIVLSGLRNLRIAAKDGAPSNEYRIQQNVVEFRALDARGNLMRLRWGTGAPWMAMKSSSILLCRPRLQSGSTRTCMPRPGRLDFQSASCLYAYLI